mmetsp:Transcript_57430/g.122164  ORF Transcript_57430/g.122164 Transcript_57430/m.122164 type:complete len:395 (+) Transcript_57430:256-1440(+)|eukprot:CAMPEP_0206435038 /NCGR_PEP_ID=MMETSP0324_2-20121206/9582_1 /ASSEMBLY_ACC=CAM_ASM_000836 /TAXON_ID=2866 /ORGANISM="Crypthecodinium cohnii, Strain Seligo" /LENGTH=394 /DNA_ID=CAMNT_0053901801 /DNA_START=182 /DNA_END=1366 /DNA_ORIENTATION=-
MATATTTTSTTSGNTPFESLSTEVQAEVRRLQSERKLAKQVKKKAKLGPEDAATESDVVAAVAAAKAPSGAAADPKARPSASAAEGTEDEEEFPDRISMDEYFEACRGCLRDPNLEANEENLALVMSVLQKKDPHSVQLSRCNYFQFAGGPKKVWDPVFHAKLAWEGFFTITSSRGREPLPELQPFYGVLTWPNFYKSRHVRKTLQRLRKGGKEYRLVSSWTQDCWKRLNDYHVVQNQTNWLTLKYFGTMQAASRDPSINFRGHCLELYTEEGTEPVAGEIGFSVGKVYTSLSGWTGARTSEAFGTIQLVLLGRCLEKKGYAFWSLGHCYSPQMEYKRQLGHRIYPRQDFLKLLHKHRGDFRRPTAGSEVFEPLHDETLMSSDLLAEAPPDEAM